MTDNITTNVFEFDMKISDDDKNYLLQEQQWLKENGHFAAVVNYNEYLTLKKYYNENKEKYDSTNIAAEISRDIERIGGFLGKKMAKHNNVKDKLYKLLGVYYNSSIEPVPYEQQITHYISVILLVNNFDDEKTYCYFSKIMHQYGFQYLIHMVPQDNIFKIMYTLMCVITKKHSIFWRDYYGQPRFPYENIELVETIRHHFMFFLWRNLTIGKGLLLYNKKENIKEMKKKHVYVKNIYNKYLPLYKERFLLIVFLTYYLYYIKDCHITNKLEINQQGGVTDELKTELKKDEKYIKLLRNWRDKEDGPTKDILRKRVALRRQQIKRKLERKKRTIKRKKDIEKRKKSTKKNKTRKKQMTITELPPEREIPEDIDDESLLEELDQLEKKEQTSENISETKEDDIRPPISTSGMPIVEDYTSAGEEMDEEVLDQDGNLLPEQSPPQKPIKVRRKPIIPNQDVNTSPIDISLKQDIEGSEAKHKKEMKLKKDFEDQKRRMDEGMARKKQEDKLKREEEIQRKKQERLDNWRDKYMCQSFFDEDGEEISFQQKNTRDRYLQFYLRHYESIFKKPPPPHKEFEKINKLLNDKFINEKMLEYEEKFKESQELLIMPELDTPFGERVNNTYNHFKSRIKNTLNRNN